MLHTCALKTSGELYCWGNNSDGELGLGHTMSPQLTPAQVAHPYPWRAVNAGYGTTCAVDTQDDLYCWGYSICQYFGNSPTLVNLP